VAAEQLLLAIQLFIAILGVHLTWKIWKLINHGNGWWLMSLGFIALFIQTIITLLAPKTSHFWYDIRLIYMPILVRLFFVLSVSRILVVVGSEHNDRLSAERKVKDNLKKIRELTFKLDTLK